MHELFGFALDIARDNSISDSINYLYALFHHLDIYEVRNAVSHPNRPFWDCYWYRVAAVASDPVNEILGLIDIKDALVSAEMGKISDPPEDWIQKVIWQIPNNLPAQFEHALTGLIGRSKELDELRKYISNPRVNTVALVAPGGSGKTALALDLLNRTAMKPSNVAHLPTPQEIEQAQESSRTLSKYASAERVHVTVRGSNKEYDDLILPGHVLQILLDVLAEMGKGNAISLMPIHQELSTQNAIVTFNLKDFPQNAPAPFGIDAIHPDDFIYYQIDMAPSRCCSAFKRQRQALKNSAMDVDEFLAILQRQQLPQTVSKLREFIDFL